MNALAGIRPRAYTAASYRAFLISGVNGRAHSLNVEAGRLLEAVDAAKVLCNHKDVLAIRETDEAGTRVHLFTIRRKAAQWVHPVGEHLPRRVQDLYADPVCVLSGEVFGVPDSETMGERR